MADDNRMVSFTLGGMVFEYDELKNQTNIRKHGLSFKSAARVFFDYDRIEFYDDAHSEAEPRYDTIGDLSAGNAVHPEENVLIGKIQEVLFVVYTECFRTDKNGNKTDVTRLISARLATNFERGLYYGKYE